MYLFTYKPGGGAYCLQDMEADPDANDERQIRVAGYTNYINIL